MKIRIFLFLVLSFVSANAVGKGISGSYTVSGKAYNNNGVPIKNGEFSVALKDKKQLVRTDSLGNYRFEVYYSTVCPSTLRGTSRRKANKVINPKWVTLEYGNNQVSLKNKWKKFIDGETKNFNVHFR